MSLLQAYSPSGDHVRKIISALKKDDLFGPHLKNASEELQGRLFEDLLLIMTDAKKGPKRKATSTPVSTTANKKPKPAAAKKKAAAKKLKPAAKKKAAAAKPPKPATAVKKAKAAKKKVTFSV